MTKVVDLHRRRVQRQPRTGRLGRGAPLEGHQEGAVRRRSADHEQPDGADGGHPGVEALQRPAKVDLYTDSKYLLDGITKWIKGWQRNGWLTSAKKPVKNDDLWRRLSEAMSRHEVTWLWVKGHAGDPGNERADALARRGIEEAATMVRSGK